MKYSFLNQVDKTVFFVGNIMEIYIPTKQFKLKMSEFRGDRVYTLGIFIFVVYTDENARGRGEGERHILKVPTYIEFQYDSTFKAKNIMGKDPDDYTVFTLKNGNIFINSTEIEQSSGAVKDILFKLNEGKIPSDIPYPEVYNYLFNSTLLNDVNLESNSVGFESIIAELYRSKTDDRVPFRKVLNKNPNTSLTDYNAINIKELPAIKGTFQALMFENLRQGVITSILKTKNGEADVETPLEEIARL